MYLATGEKMMRCTNTNCEPGRFHYRCAGLSEEDSPDMNDWFCSKECEESQDYVYCICHKHTEEDSELIQCDLEARCFKSEWYQPSCISKNPQSLPGMHNISSRNNQIPYVSRCNIGSKT